MHRMLQTRSEHQGLEGGENKANSGFFVPGLWFAVITSSFLHTSSRTQHHNQQRVGTSASLLRLVLRLHFPSPAPSFVCPPSRQTLDATFRAPGAAVYLTSFSSCRRVSPANRVKKGTGTISLLFPSAPSLFCAPISLCFSSDPRFVHWPRRRTRRSRHFFPLNDKHPITTNPHRLPENDMIR